MDNTDSSF